MSNIVVDPVDESADVEVENTVEPEETLEAGEAETQEPAFEVPDKFSGKSVEDIVKSYQNLEQELGRKSQEIGELRNLSDSFLKAEISRNGFDDKIPAGIVFTGGTSKIEGVVELAESIFQTSVRLGVPNNFVGMERVLQNPIYSEFRPPKYITEPGWNSIFCSFWPVRGLEISDSIRRKSTFPTPAKSRVSSSDWSSPKLPEIEKHNSQYSSRIQSEKLQSDAYKATRSIDLRLNAKLTLQI